LLPVSNCLAQTHSPTSSQQLAALPSSSTPYLAIPHYFFFQTNDKKAIEVRAGAAVEAGTSLPLPAKFLPGQTAETSEAGQPA